MQLTDSQQKIIDIVKKNQTMSCEEIELILEIDRKTIASDLSILTRGGMLNANPNLGYFYTEISNRSFELRNIVNKHVEDVMSIPAILDENASIYSAIITMFLKDVGSIFITKEGYLDGVVSRKDLLKSSIDGMNISELPVSIVMTKIPNVIYLEAKDTVEDAIRKLVIHEVDSLPVVDIEENTKNLIIIGRFSKTTIARLFMEVL